MDISNFWPTSSFSWFIPDFRASCVPAANFAPANDNAGAVEQTRHGPVWDIQPIKSQSQHYDPTQLVGQIVASAYILDHSTSQNNHPLETYVPTSKVRKHSLISGTKLNIFINFLKIMKEDYDGRLHVNNWGLFF